MLRNVGNSLGGDFKSQKEIKKISLEKKLASAEQLLNNLVGYDAPPGAFAGGDGGQDQENINRCQKEISKIKAELAELELKK